MESINNTNTGLKGKVIEVKNTASELCGRTLEKVKDFAASPTGLRIQAVAFGALSALGALVCAFSGSMALVAFSFGVVSLTLGMAGPSVLSFALAASKAAVAFATYKGAKDLFNLANKAWDKAAEPTLQTQTA